MKRIIFLFYCWLWLHSAVAQTATTTINDAYTPQWDRVIKLIELHKPKNAASIIDTIYNTAQQNNDRIIMLKAQLFYLQVIHDTLTNALPTLIKTAELHIKEDKFPYNAIWQSIAAQLYWDYYQANRVLILSRGTISRDILIDDIDNWDANRFFDKVASLYLKSIAHTDGLQIISIKDFAPVLFGSETAAIRYPTLFDLLANRALAYFENDEKDITKPENTFQIDNPSAFAPAGAYLNQKFATQDLTSYKWLSLQWYKQLLLLHDADSAKEAYINTDLCRLAYVYKNCVLPNKVQLYQQALQFIVASYPTEPLSAMAAYQIAQLDAGFDAIDTLNIVDTDFINFHFRIKNITAKIAYGAVSQKLNDIIAKFPNTEAATKATALLGILNHKSLGFETENIVLPNEASKFLLTYRNTDKVWVKVIKLSNVEYRKKLNNDYNSWSKSILKKSGIYTYPVQLNGAEDFYEHQAEIKIGSLPAGIYALFVSTKSNFSFDSNLIENKTFQVSSLCYISETGNVPDLKEYILNRKTGEPIYKATVIKYKDTDPKSGHEKTKTHKDGTFTFKHQSQDNYVGYLNVSYNRDTLWEPYNQPTTQQADEETNKTFLFTDRAIYRPGQTIYFKGIITQNDNFFFSTNVLKFKKTEVVFTDETGTEIKAINLITNEYGSFTGSFIVPYNATTGEMKIKNENGQIAVLIQELKKSKFKIVLDPTKTAYYINEIVRLKGSVSSFSGNSIEGATINYRVIRNVIKTKPDNDLAPSQNLPDVELLNGTTISDKEGKFAINFKALPDKTIDKKSAPIFSYTVLIEAKGFEAETHSTTLTVRAGYCAIQVIDYIPDIAKPRNIDTLNIKTLSIDGTFVATKLHLKITRFATPTKIYKKRLWNIPDEYTMDSAEYTKYFPDDEYKNESNPKYWDVAETVDDTLITTNENGLIPISPNTWQHNGWYLIEMLAKDKIGAEVYKRKYIEVWDKNLTGKNPSPLLVCAPKTDEKPGANSELTLSSGFDTCTIIRKEQNANKITNYDKLNYENKPINLHKTITEDDRGGILESFVILKNNRLYTKNVVITVPWSNKQLNLKLETKNEKILPETNETWKIAVHQNEQKVTDAEMVIALYDASFDAIKPNNWAINNLFPTVYTSINWNSDIATENSNCLVYPIIKPIIPTLDAEQNRLIIVGDSFKLNKNYELYKYDDNKLPLSINNKRSLKLANASRKSKNKKRRKKENAIFITNLTKTNVVEKTIKKETTSKTDTLPNNNLLDNVDNSIAEFQNPTTNNNKNEKKLPEFSNRRNLKPTAFFYPNLNTDTAGNIQIDFSLPESATDWKFLALAHTQDMAIGILDGKIKTQRDLKLNTILPAFLRVGDTVQLGAKISNLSDSDLQGVANIHIVDALNNQLLDTVLKLQNSALHFTVNTGQNTSVYWAVTVPNNLNTAIKISLTAQAGKTKDRKENILQVLSNKNLATKTFSFYAKDNNTSIFSFNPLLHSDTNKTLIHKGLFLEYTSNPAWFAIQSIPYITVSNTDCAEQVFNTYFANQLATQICNRVPQFDELFAKWNTDEAIAASQSVDYYKKEELKNALIETPPTELNTHFEAEQNHKLLLFYKKNNRDANIKWTLKKLTELQLPSGGFPWFSGMEENRFITQYIISGIGRLKHLEIANQNTETYTDSNNNYPIIDTLNNNTTELYTIVKRAIDYLDKQIDKEYQQLIKINADTLGIHIYTEDIQYLYMRSFYKNYPIDTKNKDATDFYKRQALKFNAKFSPAIQGMIAIACFRAGDSTDAYNITKQIKSYLRNGKPTMAIANNNQPVENYWWYNVPTEQQALLIACFKEITQDTAYIDTLTQALLQNKLPTGWATDKATEVACYALLLDDEKRLLTSPKKNERNDVAKEYYTTYVEGSQIKHQMGNIKVAGQMLNLGNNEGALYGVVNWQYYLPNLKPAANLMPVTITKELYIPIKNTKGLDWQQVDAADTLKIGDRVMVRIEINADKEMEYIQITDRIPPCFEPRNVYSGYKQQGGVGYFETVKDATNNFYINHLNIGKYVFEYTVIATKSGTYANGIATIKCMYAPDINNQSEETKIKIINK